MGSIAEATSILLTEAERTGLAALAGFTKTEYRLPQRTRIVPVAGWQGPPGDWPRAWLHGRHRVEMARALRRQSPAGRAATGNRAAKPK